jgi:hypothetical protein
MRTNRLDYLLGVFQCGMVLLASCAKVFAFRYLLGTGVAEGATAHANVSGMAGADTLVVHVLVEASDNGLPAVKAQVFIEQITVLICSFHVVEHTFAFVEQITERRCRFFGVHRIILCL